MALDEGVKLFGGVNFDDRCSTEEFLRAGGKYSMEFELFDDSNSNKCSDDDIVNLLPNDPFGMEINLCLPVDPFGMDFPVGEPNDTFDIDIKVETTIADTVGWMKKCELMACGFKNDDAFIDKIMDDSISFTGVNFVLSGILNYEQEEGNNALVDSALATQLGGGGGGSYDAESRKLDYGTGEEILCFGFEKYQLDVTNDGNVGAPPNAMFFALGHLGLKDLLSVEMVCKSLRDFVRDDTLLWRSIDIEYSLKNKVTNDILCRLTDRAQGMLSSLNIERCPKITNAGLFYVLRNNPGLTKLSVAACNGLNAKQVLSDLWVFNSSTVPGIKRLRVGNLYGLTSQQLEEFRLLLGMDEDTNPMNHKPIYFRIQESYVSLDDERPLDVETCPLCLGIRQLYDCPSESCQANAHSAMACRGCSHCIIRCLNCGSCLNDKEYQETFSFEFICMDCWGTFFNVDDVAGMPPPPGLTFYYQKGTFHFLVFS
ncbi:F-box protein SKIP14-like [Andrographis paniculata]|uniref:F-box protein SKIP14-like n=1 Tax=Andrographis paniculata TaxID=175694 RepID=UPI0021E7B5AE|nr:F-box protein SKIP14-like [Andrographis paniculata]